MSHLVTIMNDIEMLLQKPDAEKRLWDMYRTSSDENKAEVVIALIGKLMGEHAIRKSTCKNL